MKCIYYNSCIRFDNKSYACNNQTDASHHCGTYREQPNRKSIFVMIYEVVKRLIITIKMKVR
jgi:hypothetical protein